VSARIFNSFDPCNAPDEWRLEQPYERDSRLIGHVVVPEGFSTDLASTPRAVWLRFPRWGRWSGAAVVHDWLYRTQPAGISRLQADRTMQELMREDGVRRGDARVIYVSLREFGDLAWRANQRRLDEA
jgi:hypothetical protein